ncbi:MAG: ABC transporter substrate-binding protein [Oscillospiraceae bacterium]|nr:ABC transporter substrate-binding protein [Oscillospiraceae bacterium]
MKKKILGILLALVMIVALVAACTPSESGTGDTPTATDPAPTQPGETPAPPEPPEGGPRRGGTLYFATAGEPGGPIGLPWDPTLGFNAVINPFTESLTGQYPDGSTRLILSTGYTVGRDETRGENGLYYVEHTIRPGVYLHPHFLNPAEYVDAHLFAWVADRMDYYQAWPAGMIYVEATGDYTIRFYWDHMRNATPAITTGWVTSREIYEHGGNELLEQTPISAGPFRVVDVVPGSHVAFERHENYWQEGRPYLDGVTMVWATDIMVQNIGLQAEGEGRFDIVNTNTAEQAGMFQDMGYHIMALRNQTVTIVMENTNDPNSPLRNPLVRQAISMAIDRDGITSALGFGVHMPTLQYVPPGFRGRNPDPNYGAPAFNPDRARELLAEAGYADGFTTTLYPRPGSITDAAAVAVASMLADVGINAELEFLDPPSFTELRRETGWDGILICNFISWFHAEDSGRVNFEHVEGTLPNWVSLVPTERMQYLIDSMFFVGDNTAHALALADYVLDHNHLHLIPLWHQGNMHILHPRVAGWIPTDHMLFYYRTWLQAD